MQTRESAIECQALSKHYGQVAALQELNLNVPRGCIFGLLGPNGAGKSTTVGILSTLLRPSSGSARVLGKEVVKERAALRPLIGLVFQENSLDPELTAREQLRFHGRLYHLSQPRKRVDQLLERFALFALADRPVRLLSGGQRRRVEILRGMLHMPTLLFLDEPCLGLDVASRAELWNYLQSLVREEGLSIFLTTHSMEEADALCDQIAIIDAGKCVVEGTPSQLKSQLGGDVVHLCVQHASVARDAIEAYPKARLLSQPVIAKPGPAKGSSAVSWLAASLKEGSRNLPELLRCLEKAEVLELELHRPSLAQVFLHYTGHPFESKTGDEVE